MTLADLGWNPFWEECWKRSDRGAHIPARVTAEQRDLWRLAGESFESSARLSGRLRHGLTGAGVLPAVGDWVETAAGVIYDVLPRRSRLSRKAAGRRTDEQVVAANVDTVFIMSSLNRDYNLRRLERYVTLAWEGGARPVILLSKADLCESSESWVAAAEAIAPDVPVVAVSAYAGSGLDRLHIHLRPAQTVALVGSSGVGKSTLINRLCGGVLQRTADIGPDHRGRHTTTSRELIALPSGTLLIDTPGLRELQLWSSGEGLDHAFGEIEELAGSCRFRDCSHTNEPGCAVLQAVEAGELPASRFESYLKLRREVDYLARKLDVSAQQAEKRRWRMIHKAQKAQYKAGRKRF
jgi:ribosome biogenesis GTPase